ncbi:DMT family transporter [Pseudomonas sp. FP2309]|uniref:DMT family transporter n=1 Tax=Pseudomonas sp. FP2309 TaxID=2954091 RepID=UPI00273698DE|nr:EamA family transporter [Pseudomonas sp. FP2309]WLH68706.1 EamA family transporter [Pseudomonas sp. FP2309]
MKTLTRSFNIVLPATLLPLLFIVMWSSGYVVGKVALPFVGPYTLIFIRFASAALVLLAVALLTKAPWPKTRAQFGHIVVVGLLIQALQFAGLYMGLDLGVSAAVAALIVGTMPVFTALGATRFLNEKVSRIEWLGLIGGLFGVALVVYEQLGASATASLTGYLCVVLALIGITTGSLYQKKYCSSMDLRTGGFIQLATASFVMFFFAEHFENMAVQWTPTMIFASGWLSLVNSIGAISILYVLMRKGEASKVAGLFHLIPAVTALMGFAFLGESFSAINAVGFAITALAVYACTHAKK